MLATKYIDEPTVENLPELPYVAIAVQATLLEWKKVDELVDEIYEWLARRNIEPAGPLFYRYWVIGDEEKAFHVEVGVPLEKILAGDERVISGFIPGGSYVSAIHQGPPDHLEKSLNEMEIWAKKEGLELDRKREGEVEIWNGRFESYLTNPATDPDLTQWKIRIFYLILRDDAA